MARGRNGPFNRWGPMTNECIHYVGVIRVPCVVVVDGARFTQRIELRAKVPFPLKAVISSLSIFVHVPPVFNFAPVDFGPDTEAILTKPGLHLGTFFPGHGGSLTACVIQSCLLDGSHGPTPTINGKS